VSTNGINLFQVACFMSLSIPSISLAKPLLVVLAAVQCVNFVFVQSPGTSSQRFRQTGSERCLPRCDSHSKCSGLCTWK